MVKDTPLSLAQDHFFWTWYWYFHVNETLTSPYFTFSLKYVSFWRRFNFPPGKGFPLLTAKVRCVLQIQKQSGKGVLENIHADDKMFSVTSWQ